MKDSINKSLEYVDIIKTSLISFKERQKEAIKLDNPVFEEFTLADIISDIDFLLKQIILLKKDEKLLLNYTTLNDRNNIFNYLTQLNSYLEQNNLSLICQSINNLKSIIRLIPIFINDKNINNLLNSLTEVIWKNAELERDLLNYKNIINKINQKKYEIDWVSDELSKNNDILKSNISNLENEYNNLNNKVNTATIQVNQITEILNKAKSNEWVINNFISEIEEWESKLKNQEKQTLNYETKLSEYTKKYIEILEEANTLIISAKQALNYKTAEWISSAIQTQYESENDWHKQYWWIIWAWVFVLIALWIAIWILSWQWASNTIDWKFISVMIWRIFLIPVSLWVAWFCSKQYLKQKNLSDDYAYKMVLTKSIVWFSETLLKVKETNAWYQSFIKKVLDEIMRDPLRERKSYDDLEKIKLELEANNIWKMNIEASKNNQ